MSYMNDMEVAYNEKPVCFNYHSYLNAVSDVARLTTENEALKAQITEFMDTLGDMVWAAVNPAQQRLLMTVKNLAEGIFENEVQHE